MLNGSNIFEANLSVISGLKILLIGTVYDASFLSYALIPISLIVLLMPNKVWQSKINQLFIHLLSFSMIVSLMMIAVAELLFWSEFQARFNFISVDYLVYRREVTDNISESFPIKTYMSLIIAVATVIYWRLSSMVSLILRTSESMKPRLAATFSILFIAASAYFGLEQRLNHFSDNNYQNELASNGPYQFIAAFLNNELDYNQFYISVDDDTASDAIKQEVLIEHSDKTNLYDIKRNVVAEGAEKHLNVILIMVESLSANYLGAFGNTENITPNLDQISKESLLFTQHYATGTRTVRGLEAVTLSIPPTPGRSIVKRMGRESNMWSLGSVLKSKGYESRFLYGGRGYFDNMNAFFSGNGYEITDQSNIPKKDIGFQNAWGVADEYLFEQVIKQADRNYSDGKPFFFHIMTTSNHRPFTYPDDRIDLKGGRNGGVKYTDWAIGNFIKQAKETDWFENTMFVIIADHTSGSAGKSALAVDKYHIPLMIYSPKHIEPGVATQVSSQVDVAPTLLALLNMSYTSNFFGKNILAMREEDGRAFIGNYQHLGLYKPGRLSILSPRKVMSIINNPATDKESLVYLSEPDEQMLQAIASYQSASYVYDHKLNAWDVGHMAR